MSRLPPEDLLRHILEETEYLQRASKTIERSAFLRMRRCGEQREHLAVVGWFREMMVEAGLARALAAFFLAVSPDRDQQNVRQ